MSESLHAGHLPLWNPYINFGFPQYGDMSGGFWSPITWLIASTVGYTAYTLTLEVLLYILLGGLGMYTLTSIWKMDKNIRIIAGVAYMCCGYNIGHLQHFNWISGAAFLPWVFWSYWTLLEHYSFKNTILAVLLLYLLVSSAHPGIIISAAYFFLAIGLFHLIKNESKLPLMQRIKLTGKTHIFLCSIFTTLCAGMIVGYLDILPYFIRGEKISLATSLSDPSTIQSWMSTLLPLATVKNDAYFKTDISMRNNYFSVALLLFFLLACLTKKSSWQKFLLMTGILFALLSMGGIFKIFAFKFIPFIGYVRLNGEFRIFALLCFILFSATEADTFFKQKKQFSNKIKWGYYAIEIILITCIVVGLYIAIASKIGVLYSFKNILSQLSISLKLKALIDAIHFVDAIWIQAAIQLLICWGIKRSLQLSNLNLLKKIVVADLVIASLFNIPFTGVGRTSVAQIQTLLNRSPKGIPIPNLQPIKKNDTTTAEQNRMIGDWSMYSKQIGTIEEVAYPIILKNMDAYFTNRVLHPKNTFLDQPFIFIENKNIDNNVILHSFSPVRIQLTAIADSASRLIIQQNHYPHWFYQNGKEKKDIQQEGINFMSIPIKKGKNEIIIQFEPDIIKYATVLSAVVFIILCVLLFIPFSTPSFPSSPNQLQHP